jgi:hypothetical protein
MIGMTLIRAYGGAIWLWKQMRSRMVYDHVLVGRLSMTQRSGKKENPKKWKNARL